MRVVAMTFDEILKKFREEATSNENLGSRFEMLMRAYLRTDPKYADRFSEVWLWNEFFGRYELGEHDMGIDLVAQTKEGEFWAVQCKCYAPEHYIDKPAVDTFITTSGRQFTNQENKLTGFVQRLWISTTSNWKGTATTALLNQVPPVSRIGLNDLRESPIDWGNLYNGIIGEKARLPRKSLRPHQMDALNNTQAYFENYERGKLIMACGTGKTFTSLRIAEMLTQSSGLVLFLVPSIALLGQALNEWYAEAETPINAICICSDPTVSTKKTKNRADDDSVSVSVIDLALPASTDKNNIEKQFERIQNKQGMKVVFSTYQSIKVIEDAQRLIAEKIPKFAQFDLIICDEAHRTTGMIIPKIDETTGKTLGKVDESAFIRVHNNDFIKAKKRLYMTATPRLYSDNAKSQAAEKDVLLCSMDDPQLYGEEIYRIGFGTAVSNDLLSDYKVLILTINENEVPPTIIEKYTHETEIQMDDVAKLVGCINALSKQVIGDGGTIKNTDPEPMRRAVAFCRKILISENTTRILNNMSGEQIKFSTSIVGSGNDTTTSTVDDASHPEPVKLVKVNSQHIDGTMGALKRTELVNWLKEEPALGECRILTNAKCLSEGVDVPALDAVMFLSPKNSPIDVVQSVGRVMRKAPGKNYGYIIIPVVVPAVVEAEKALDDNKPFEVVWTVLNALRAHDERFEAIINSIELNNDSSGTIDILSPGNKMNDDGSFTPKGDIDSMNEPQKTPEQLKFSFNELQNVMMARIVLKVGRRLYWEQWASSVADIATMQIARLTAMVKDGKYKEKFEVFIEGLRKEINPSITETDAIEMLSQHLITKPVFEALFEGYSFALNNPISITMQGMINILTGSDIEKETATLQRFYDSVKEKASTVRTAEGKQKIIIELYDKFFKTAFPKMVERLGIVYTPVEVVDFIIHSVNDVLKQEFGKSIADRNVNILDPFTGTGTFITRLIQSGLIPADDLVYKYHHELHANEIVLLAYYIATINIENAFHDTVGSETYSPFEGICLTDTFQLGETEGRRKIKIPETKFSKSAMEFSNSELSDGMYRETLPQNSERVDRQKSKPITVIMGNPPYSIGQKAVNDNAKNQEYPMLNIRIVDTYVKESKAVSKRALFDSYIKAFRWSADRLDDKEGIIAFVTNGGWLDSNSMDGFRKALEKEFASVYVFDLRGNQRTSGELSKREGGKIFGSGSRSPITITLLVKKQKINSEKANLSYYDIGDYLTREQKLKIISEYTSFTKLPLVTITPNKHGDWISIRNDDFSSMIPLEPNTKFNTQTHSFFNTYSLGIATAKDAFLYNYNKERLILSVESMIDFYNNQRIKFHIQNEFEHAKDFVLFDNKKINWNDMFLDRLEKDIKFDFNKDSICMSLYRPFTKQFFCYDKQLIQRTYQQTKLFPTAILYNLLICVTGLGSSKDFSVMASSSPPSIDFVDKTQCFPLYYYEENKTHKSQGTLFDSPDDNKYIRKDGVSDFILKRCHEQYGKNVTKEDIFYYVYGFLHSPEYREQFSADLKKMLPRLPLVDDVRDFWAFSKAGRQLAELHLHYESQPHHPDVVETILTLPPLREEQEVPPFQRKGELYKVHKMTFADKDKTTIKYNNHITLSNIPLQAYDYIVNGKSAIEWIMERYRITTHKESGITNDPNDWCAEVGNPRYILDLLHSVIYVSVQTVEIVSSLPKLTLSTS